MGYILILLVFLIYRNTVNIRKAVYYTAYDYFLLGTL